MSYILIALFCYWFTAVVKIPWGVMEYLCDKRLVYRTYYGQPMPRRIKPFDCHYCLAFWVSLCYAIWVHENLFHGILYAALSSLFAFHYYQLASKL
jgi:hypothetical protein